MFSGVKVFSATRARDRASIGEDVARWLRTNSDLEVVDQVVVQSSDDAFHCVSVVVFYGVREELRRAAG